MSGDCVTSYNISEGHIIYYRDKKDIYDSQQTCSETTGLALAILRDQESFNSVISHYPQSRQCKSDYYRVGLRRKNSETFYTWTDGRRYNNEFGTIFKFNDNNSNDCQSVAIYSKNRNISTTKLHSFPCNEKISFLCFSPKAVYTRTSIKTQSAFKAQTSTSQPSTSSTSDTWLAEQQAKEIGVGLIAGLIASLALVVLLLAITVYLVRKKRSRSGSESNHTSVTIQPSTTADRRPTTIEAIYTSDDTMHFTEIQTKNKAKEIFPNPTDQVHLQHYENCNDVGNSTYENDAAEYNSGNTDVKDLYAQVNKPKDQETVVYSMVNKNR
ncbi:uncharacterized protein LOC143444290 [Clavelina lepadiformis]|uniref:uncharacterized protein LOC143444290 n=1 Tax=Clavelina lepadiformis TaxID=159417 RepID=UPI004042A319